MQRISMTKVVNKPKKWKPVWLSYKMSLSRPLSGLKTFSEEAVVLVLEPMQEWILMETLQVRAIQATHLVVRQTHLQIVQIASAAIIRLPDPTLLIDQYQITWDPEVRPIQQIELVLMSAQTAIRIVDFCQLITSLPILEETLIIRGCPPQECLDNLLDMGPPTEPLLTQDFNRIREVISRSQIKERVQDRASMLTFSQGCTTQRLVSREMGHSPWKTCQPIEGLVLSHHQLEIDLASTIEEWEQMIGVILEIEPQKWITLPKGTMGRLPTQSMTGCMADRQDLGYLEPAVYQKIELWISQTKMTRVPHAPRLCPANSPQVEPLKEGKWEIIPIIISAVLIIKRMGQSSPSLDRHLLRRESHLSTI